jgi:hypothetical protein
LVSVGGVRELGRGEEKGRGAGGGGEKEMGERRIWEEKLAV